MKKGFSAALPALLSGAGLASLAVRELYRYSFTREGSALLDWCMHVSGNDKGHEDAYYEFRDALKEKAKALPQTRLSLRNTRGERLAGFYFPAPKSDGKHVAFIVHGYRSEHAETAGLFLPLYHKLGFDVFAPDNTAHGESGGRYVGYGVRESSDCLEWLSLLKERAGAGAQIILHGLSLGGATVMAMSDRIGPEVKFIVEDSGYTEAETLLKRSPCFSLLKTIHRLCSGIRLEETDVRPHLMRASIPILFVQGTEDKLVPAENGPALYALYPGPKDCLFVPGARHIESIWRDPEGYEAKIRAMIARTLS